MVRYQTSPVNHVNDHSTKPNSDATGSSGLLRTEQQDGEEGGESPTREAQEREAAWRRGRARRRAGAEGHDHEVGRANPELVHRAFAALAENVRDYAIFLMDADGVIRFWGEGARLLKRWSKEEAEGAHLRLLYLEGGSEDGTAEEHLRQAAEYGEYVGEGHRVRGDSTLLWARVTLTGLKDENGILLGFSKVTIDLSTQRETDSVRSVARFTRARAERTDMTAEIDVLKEEVAVLRDALEKRDQQAGES
jgi:PAS domain S-box-containing protein